MRVRVVLACALLLAVPACGGSDEAGEPVATNQVTMAKSYRFEPETITIEAGQTVTWTNDDNFTHTVEIEIEGQGDHRVEPGDTVSVTFDEPGTYDYVCTLHRRDMEGQVIVT